MSRDYVPNATFNIKGNDFPVSIKATSGVHIACFVNGLTIHRVSFDVRIYIKKEEAGNWTISDFSMDRSERDWSKSYSSERDWSKSYSSERDWSKSYSSQDPSTSALGKAQFMLFPLVHGWALAHPYEIAMANLDDLENSRNRNQQSLDDASEFVRTLLIKRDELNEQILEAAVAAGTAWPGAIWKGKGVS